MTKGHRIERINATVKEIISEILLVQIKDPRIGLVTITSVSVSSDLTSARVHYSVMGDEAQQQETRNGLVSARRFMRGVIARELKVRYAPELKFIYDDSLDRAMRIEEALRDSGGDGAGEEE